MYTYKKQREFHFSETPIKHILDNTVSLIAATVFNFFKRFCLFI